MTASDAPPPLPSAEAIKLLRDTAAALDVEEILDLCYAFQSDPVRLTVYVDALRMKGSGKAQAAACLVCFDLARQGKPESERDFLALVPVMIEFLARPGTTKPRAVDELVEESAYLRALLADLEARLEGADPRTDLARVDEIVVDETFALEVSLLDDDDLAELDLSGLDAAVIDDERFRDAWDDALSRFLGAPGDASTFGFSAVNRASLEKVERLRDDALSLAEHVDGARELLPLAELFLASHQRAKNLFGRVNRAREATLRSGLAHFTALPAPPTSAASWFETPTAAAFAWEKLAEVLLDYVAFLGALPPGTAPRDMPVTGFADAYLAAERPQPPPPRLAAGDRRRR